MIQSTFWVGFPLSVKLLWRYPHRHTQRYVSQWFCPVKLAVRMNPHRDTQLTETLSTESLALIPYPSVCMSASLGSLRYQHLVPCIYWLCVRCYLFIGQKELSESPLLSPSIILTLVLTLHQTFFHTQPAPPTYGFEGSVGRWLVGPSSSLSIGA